MTHSKRHPLRNAFITTAATAGVAFAMAISGCATVTEQAETCDFGDPGCEQACPNAAPLAGMPCNQDGQNCSWGDSCTSEEAWGNCDGTSWQISGGGTCNPPPPDPTCPPELPLDGNNCDSWAGTYQCDGYPEPSCGGEVSAICDAATGQWSVPQTNCNPPPLDLCLDQIDAASCAGIGFCAWLEPGCDANPLPAAGCYAADDCAVTGCFGDATCTEMSVHPCPDGDCNACGMQSNVCLPNDTL
jgi:hypothetical protein